MSNLKTVIGKTPGAEFANEVNQAVAAGTDYATAFNNTLRRRPDLARALRRAPLVGTARLALRHKLQAAFVNADADLFPGLVKNLSEPMRKTLGVTPDDSPDAIRNALASRISGMPSTTIAQVWAAIVQYLTSKNAARNPAMAAAQAKQMFPALAAAAGMA